MFVFDHIGITTTVTQPGENWVEQSRVWVTNPRTNPEHIELLRDAEGTTVPDIVRNNPHIAFRVEALAPRTWGGRKMRRRPWKRHSRPRNRRAPAM